MTKKKKPAKKQAAKAKVPTQKAPPARPKAPAAKSEGIAKPPPAVSASPTTQPPATASTGAKTFAPAKEPSIAVSNGGGGTNRGRAAPEQKHVRPTGGKSEDKRSGKRPPEIGVISDSVSEAALPLQTFAVEMQRMAKQSMDQTAEVLERLRDAKNVEEVVSLQTTFMQQSFRRYTEFAGRISQLITSSQTSLFQQGQAAMRNFRSIASGM